MLALLSKKKFLRISIAFCSGFQGRTGMNALMPARRFLTTRAPSEE
jgi:hypothetical protein